MYKTNAIILKKIKIRDGLTLCHVLSREYGKISIWIKGPRDIGDTGSIVACILDRVGTRTYLTSWQAVHTLDPSISTYDHVHILLRAISSVDDISPEGVPHTGIFDDYIAVYTRAMQRGISVRELYILLLRILKIYGICNPQRLEKAGMQSIYTHIDTIDIIRILDSEKVGPEHIQVIYDTIRESMLGWEK